MNKMLEPTEEQLQAIERAAFRSDGPSFAHIIWRLIAPMVLQAAAQACEVPGNNVFERLCAERIRALMGSR